MDALECILQKVAVSSPFAIKDVLSWLRFLELTATTHYTAALPPTSSLLLMAMIIYMVDTTILPIDYVYAGNGNDRISGENIFVYAGNGDDDISTNTRATVYGGAGNDVFSFAHNLSYRGEVLYDGESGFDLLEFSQGMAPSRGDYYDIGAGITVRYNANGSYQSVIRFANIEEHSGSNGVDYITGSERGDNIGFSKGRQSPNDGQDRLMGRGGDDTINGGYQGDTVDGGAGNDLLYGGDDYVYWQPADIIIGGPGNDTLIGAQGGDFLYGNEGADRFVYLTATDSAPRLASAHPQDLRVGKDTIYDFNATEGDVIDLSAIDANALWLSRGNQAFRAVSDFTGSAGELTIKTQYYGAFKTGVNISGDTNGDAIPDLLIYLEGRSVTITSDNILL